MKKLKEFFDEALFSSASEFSKADDTDDNFVDLGLSVNWAKCNLGAEEETDPGHYYMWGSTKPDDNDWCDWVNAPFNNEGNYFDSVYFNSVKNKVCQGGVLASEYDAAYRESNGEYRMPTKEEFDELINKTNQEWVENYKETKVNGMKFTNKSDSTKFIFIPAVGYRAGNITSGSPSYTYIWTASLHTNNNYLGSAYRVFIHNSYVAINAGPRRFALIIRPVQEK